MLLTTVLLLVQPGCTPLLSNAGGETPPWSLAVLYATDRVPVAAAGGTRYPGERGRLGFGVTEVQFEQVGRARPGQRELDALEPGRSRSPSYRTRLQRSARLSDQQFFQQLQQRLASAADASVILYLHGYARDFDQAAETTARLATELDFPGVPLFFSWPSRGNPAAYLGDLATLDWSLPHLEQLLRRLLRLPQLGRLHLVAHSLGNRLLLEALVALSGELDRETGSRLGEIVLLAPDLDRDLFERDLVPVLRALGTRVTLYVSAVDIPLHISRRVHLYPRVGDVSDGVMVIEGIETVDTSQVADFTQGHAYFRRNDAVLDDLRGLLVEGQGASLRPGLRAVDTPQGRFWELTPGSESDHR